MLMRWLMALGASRANDNVAAPKGMKASKFTLRRNRQGWARQAIENGSAAARFSFRRPVAQRRRQKTAELVVP